MKPISKILFFLFSFLLLAGTYCFCQQTAPPVEDEKFNLFLFSLAFMFVCALMGAAIIGALTAILILSLIFGLVTMGIISTSVVVGIYKRSIGAGFATFMYFAFCISCMAISTGGLFLVKFFVTIPYTNFTLLLTGLGSGLLAGLILGFCTYKLLQLSAQTILKKLAAAQYA
jgi:hypothetical protein